MIDFRVKKKDIRMEYFLKYFHWSLKFYDCDPSMFLINYINERMELNKEQRFWFAWLYGNTYQLATAWVIANEFPDFENVDEERLEWWNSNNYTKLRYQSDQKWQKGHLPKMFNSYKENIYKNHDSQEEFFKSICKHDCPKKNFDDLYDYVVNNFFKFGRYSAWFYIQTLKETCDINVEPSNLILKHSSTHTQRDGLCYAYAKDEWVGDKDIIKNKAKLELLDEISFLIIDMMKENHPDVKSDMFLLETTLCAFKKTFRKNKGRYLGYYLDRQFEDIKKVQEDNWAGIDWDLLWQGRKEILDHRTIRDTGVSKEDMEYFLETGKIKYIDYLKN